MQSALPLTKTAEIVPCLSSQKAAKGHCSAIMGKFECACGSCLGIVGAILLLGCISLTNVYAQAYEPERSSNLARIAGRYLLTGIFLAVLAVGACAGAKAGVAVACGVCLGVIVSILAMICGILIAVSAGRNPSNEGTNWGAAAATFSFLTMFTPWCTICGVMICSATSGSRRGGGDYSHTVHSPTPEKPKLNLPDLENLTEEEKKKYAVVILAIMEQQGVEKY